MSQKWRQTKTGTDRVRRVACGAREGRGEMLDERFMRQLMLAMILAGIIVAIALERGWVRW